MPFKDSSKTYADGTSVQSKTFTAPRSAVQTQGDQSFTQGGNYGNTGINSALTTGPVASRIAQLDAANPGMNLRARLTAGARDAITGFLGDGKTGGRFDINSPYYRDAILRRVEEDANSAAAIHAAGQHQQQMRQSAGQAAQGQMGGGPQMPRLPYDVGLPGTMSRGSFMGSDGIQHTMAVPTAGNYTNGAYDRDMALLQQRQGLQGDNYGDVLNAVTRQSNSVRGYAQQQLNDQRNADLMKAALPAMIAGSYKQGQQGVQDKKKQDAKNQTYVENIPKTRTAAANKVQSIVGGDRGDIGRRASYYSKQTGKRETAPFADVNAGNAESFRQLPQMPDTWSLPAPGAGPGGERQVNLPNAATMYNNPQWYKHLMNQIVNVAKTPEEQAMMIQQYDKMLRESGQQGFWNSQAGNTPAASNIPTSPPQGTVPAPQANPAQTPQAVPPAQPAAPVAPQRLSPVADSFVRSARPEDVQFIKQNLRMGVAGLQSLMQGHFSPHEIQAAVQYARELGAK